MKTILAILILASNIGFSHGLSFNGNVNYLKQNNQNLVSGNNMEYSVKIYENHKYMISISNALNFDLDCFKNEIKETNVFTTVKIEF